MALFLEAAVVLLFCWNHAVAALFRASAETATPLKQRLPFYHSSDELRSAFQDAALACKTASVTIESRHSQDSDVSLDVAFVRGSGAGDAGTHQKQKALLFFGEHARELVSSESALHFLKSICGLGSVPEEKVRKTLASTEFVIVPNANPLGRKLVDSGNFCKRTNENGVDLNRNWGTAHRGNDPLVAAAANGVADNDDSDGAQEENPGPTGFSEPETQVLRDLARDISPRLFLSIHSGAYLLGMPFGYSDSERPEHADEMVNMLSGISSRYCSGQCPYGALAQTIGYRSAGCSIDYFVEELKVPFAFTWEIYTDSTHTKKFADEAQDDKDAGRKGSTGRGFWDHLTPNFKKMEAEASSAPQSGPNPDVDEACMSRFNPMTEGALDSVLDTWSKAYLDVADQVAAIPASGATSTSQHASQTSSSEGRDDGAQSSAAQSDSAKSSAAPVDGAFHPASAAEYVELMREQQVAKEHNSRQPLKDDALDVDDQDEKLSPQIPSWDALKPGGTWGFLTNHLQA